MRIAHGSRVIAEHALTAENLCSRLIGLIGRRNLPAGSALIIPGCYQVHTCGVRFPIDVLFLNEDNIILAVETLPPWRISTRHPGASKAIELPAGTIKESGIRPGDEVSFSE